MTNPEHHHGDLHPHSPDLTPEERELMEEFTMETQADSGDILGLPDKCGDWFRWATGESGVELRHKFELHGLLKIYSERQEDPDRRALADSIAAKLATKITNGD